MFTNNRVSRSLSVLILTCLILGAFLTQPQQVDAGAIRVTVTDHYYTCETFDGIGCQASNWTTTDIYEPW